MVSWGPYYELLNIWLTVRQAALWSSPASRPITGSRIYDSINSCSQRLILTTFMYQQHDYLLRMHISQCHGTNMGPTYIWYLMILIRQMTDLQIILWPQNAPSKDVILWTKGLCLNSNNVVEPPTEYGCNSQYLK